VIADEFYKPRDVYLLSGLQVTSGTMGMPTATVRLRGPDGIIHTVASIGTGPVDATYKAIDSIVNVPCTLLEFNIHAITEGIDALGEVTVRIQSESGAPQWMRSAKWNTSVCMAVMARIQISSLPARRHTSTH
jgi:2-isopropylmalate synthase